MPYTYSMLNTYLNKNVTKNKAKRQTLCYSLAGNKVEYLHITNKNKTVETIVEQDASSPTKTKRQKSPNKKDKGVKKVVVHTEK